MKTCTKCKENKPVTEFNRLSKTVDGLQYHCKACKSAYQRANNKRAEVAKRYRDANRETCIARSVASQRKKREQYTAKAVAWQRANPDKVKAIKQRAKEKLAEAGGISAERRAQRNAKAAAYRAAFPDKVEATLRVCRRKWLSENKEKDAALRKAYSQTEAGQRKRKAATAAYIASGGRARAEARRAMKPTSEACKEAVLRYQLQRRAQDTEMSAFDFFVLSEAVKLRKLREKLLGGKWHVDHVRPVSLGGSSRANNLQVVPALWNIRKGNRHTERFLGAQND